MTVTNFRLVPSPLRLKSPTVEIVHPRFPNPEVDVDDFQAKLLKFMTFCFEQLLAGLLSKRVRRFAGLEFVLRFLPPEHQSREGVRFGFDFIGPPLPEEPSSPPQQ